MKRLTTRDQTTEVLLYTAPNGGIKVEVLLSHETIWLTQKRIHLKSNYGLWQS